MINAYLLTFTASVLKQNNNKAIALRLNRCDGPETESFIKITKISPLFKEKLF